MGIERVSISYDGRAIRKLPYLVRWYGQSTEGTPPKRYSKSFRLKKDAEKFAAELQHEFDQGIEQRDRPRRITLDDFTRDWIKAREAELRSGTLRLYREAIERMLLHFGKTCLLENITPRNASLFIGSLRRNRRLKKDSPLATWSKARLLRNCKTVLQTAVEWGYIRSNPFRTIKSPKLEVRRWHYITPEEYRRMSEIVTDLYQKAFYAVAYTAGLRFGELCSLTWQDIDFQRGEVYVCSKPGTATMPPFDIKDHEARVIPLPKHTLDILAALHAEAPVGVPYVLVDEKRYQIIMARWQGRKEQGKDWTNKHMMNNALQRFRVHVKKAGIKPTGLLTFHCLRKSCGQNWANHLPIHVTMKLMGHSSVTTTQMFYSQVEPHHHVLAAEAIQKLVGEPSKGETAATQEGAKKSQSS